MTKKHIIKCLCFGVGVLGFSNIYAQVVLPWTDFYAATRLSQQAPIYPLSMSEFPGDAVIDALETKDGGVNVVGRLSKTNRSKWVTLGVDLGHSVDTMGEDMSGFTNMRIRLSSPQKRIVRIRLKGFDSRLQKNGCYPIMLQEVGPVPTDYLIPLASFESERSCGNEAISPEAVLNDLMSVEVSVNEPSDAPIRFTIGRIDFVRSTVATATNRVERSLDWKLAWADEFDGATNNGLDEGKWAVQPMGEKGGRNPQSSELGLDGQGHLQLHPLTGDSPIIRAITKPALAMLYGRIDVQFKPPSSTNVSGRIALIGSPMSNLKWPDTGEIVLAELEGGSNNLTLGVFGPGLTDGSGMLDIPLDQDFLKKFHTISLEWEPGHMRWLLDDVLLKDINRAQLPAAAKVTFDQWPYRFQLSTEANGGSSAKLANEAALLVDSVRIYKRADLVSAAAERLNAWLAKNSNSAIVEKNSPAPKQSRASSSQPQSAPAQTSRQVVCTRDNKYGLMLCF